jgi:hypothetical protein
VGVTSALEPGGEQHARGGLDEAEIEGRGGLDPRDRGGVVAVRVVVSARRGIVGL